MKLEALIEKHRPLAGEEDEPASGGHLWHLNRHKLLMKAVRRQLEREGRDVTDIVDRKVVVTKLTAWEVLSDAQRNGLRLTPPRGVEPSRTAA